MALYRKKRPATFDEVVGQDHVKEVLKNAIKKDRLAHAYLFSGPRGVGKTTMARILAMATGCAAGPEERPCGVCEHCRMVREGRHPDVLEVDAASNNSVEDVRELKEQILLAPVLAPKKVIILDEAHMMSKSAFNALLKTLEEPPEHVLFIFATTEPERMPATVKSRTQHFRFHRLSEETIKARLKALAEEEGVEVEEEALALLARAAEGAMRDALVLFERLLVVEHRPLTRADAERLLGLPPAEAVARLLMELERGEVERALELATSLFLEGYAPRTLVAELKGALKERVLEHPDPALLEGLLALDEAEERLAKEESRLGLELALLRLYHAMRGRAKPSEPPPPRPKPTPEPPRPKAASPEEGWQALLKGLPAPLRAVVREARPEVKGGRLVLHFRPHLRFHIERARAEQKKIAALAEKALGVREVVVAVEEGEGPAPEPEEEEPSPPPPPPSPSRLVDDPRFKRVLAIFNAEILSLEERPPTKEA